MKLSNKLLIGLATILLVVPICVCYIVVKANRADAHTYRDLLYKEATSLQVPDKYMRTVSVEPFKKVKLLGSGNTSINLQHINSDRFAIKADKDKESDFVYHIDDQGNLEIDFQNRKQYSQLSISIFSPNVEELTVSNIHIQDFTIQAPEFHVSLEKQSAFSFGLNTKIDHLYMNVSQSNLDMRWVDVVNEPMHGVRDLTLDLNSSSVRIHKRAFGKLYASIKDSEIAFNLQKDTTGHIEEMNIFTKGKSAVYMNGTEIKSLLGSLSDQTMTDLPVYHLRKLLNSK
ncbi:hypothetical protein FAZ19_17145 [Sphingobacterium alkalisoli]|uniref:Uncharacterized protein n=1 Tax=Sphingobacterium alkalisoli TaxID=1874115 RepID=A0A4U0H171_9SPHI|nr:hypothetical protein [Sphingobacterium alkalisoli]TJY63982.1 hypothetical protein FAZ19_17145 [Sphingobacterium alkalisoli]GGH23647.1 hypothetical protein GCM10011418_31000 [Sphingobacterium alkalisoli]